jgi:hypothetical protein
MAQDVEEGALEWGVKQSLLGYVEHAGGSIEVLPPAVRRSDRFIYPQAARNTHGSPQLQFEGSVRLFAHDGLMDVLLADPAIEFDGSTYTLTVRTGDHEREAVARLVPVEPTADSWASEYEARLLFAGSRLLGDVYDVNTVLEPVTIFTSA